MKWTVVLLATCALPACSTIGSRPSVPNNSYLEYSLPFTTATVGMDAVLQSCDPPQIAGTVTISPIANPSYDAGERFRIYGSDLDSFTKSRQLSLELYPNTAIKSVNGGVADRTGAIVTNILKTAAGLIPLATGSHVPRSVPTPATSSVCTPEIRKVVQRVDTLKKEIGARRAALPKSAFLETTKLHDSIDALAAEVARLQSGPLKIHVEREIAFRRGTANPAPQGGRTGDTDAGIIRWGADEFADWFGSSGPGDTELFSLMFCVDEPSSSPPLCPLTRTTDAQKAAEAANGNNIQRPSCYVENDPRASCRGVLILRNPARRTMRVFPVEVSRFSNAGPVDPLAKQAIEVSQWGEVTELPLRATFGQNYTFAFGMDEFGNLTSGSWKSDARGENITGSLASIAEAAGGVKNGFKTDVQQDQDEITRLETKQKRNQLEFCRLVIEAGGFTCPDAPKP